MGRSDNNVLVNPAKKFFKWEGSSGRFSYFDKTKGENGERVQVELPFQFLVLDTLSTVKGWSDPLQSGIWANEVYNISEDVLTVRTKAGILKSGLYESVKSENGVKYCQSVYAAVRCNGDLEMCNIAIMGTAIGAWIEYRKKHKNIYDGGIAVNGTVEGKKGAVKFFSPVFTPFEITPEENEQAIAMHKELKKYLAAYFRKDNKPERLDHHIVERIATPMPDDGLIPPPEELNDLPF